VRHWDYLVVPEGNATIGLVDLRPGSATFRNTQTVRMQGDSMSLLTIPPGVAHGFHFGQSGVFLYGLSHYWDPVNDEFACRWDDPELGLDWQIEGRPSLSEKDASAGNFSDLQKIAEKHFSPCA
jgi:dTDP-4-dehydrorhamnose 3,5-epimerase